MVNVLVGDVLDRLRELPADHFHCCVTSPPYFGLRDYGHTGQIGLEKTPREYAQRLVDVFREVRRVLRPDGTVWLNLGDSYAQGGNGGHRASAKSHGHSDRNGDCAGNPKRVPGFKPKDLLGMPWRVAFALQEDGWWLRNEIIWWKPNKMPESVRDRFTYSHEQVFLLAKSQRYYFDALAVAEEATHAGKVVKLGEKSFSKRQADGAGVAPSGNGLAETYEVKETRNRRSVWRIPTRSYRGAHFATFPPELPRLCLKAGASEKGCCATCGKPWRRVVERSRKATRPGVASKVYEAPPVHPESPLQSHNGTICGNRDPQRHTTVATTTGWEPGCHCGGDPAPCRALDIFAGSGTTGAVAQELGLDCTLIELNSDYLPLIQQRLNEPLPAKKPKGTKPTHPELLPLFQ